MEIENLCDEKALPGDDSETSESPENENSNEEKESLYDEEDDKLEINPNGRGQDFSEYEIGFVSGGMRLLA